MVQFSLSELAASAGTASGNFAKDAANGAANFVCGLYKDFPGTLLKSPASSFIGGFWDTLCANRAPGLPGPPPPPPFTGGQCPTMYTVNCTGEYTSNGVVKGSSNGSGDVPGPVLGIRIIDTGSNWRLDAISTTNTTGSNPTPDGFYGYRLNALLYNFRWKDPRITTVVRKDAQPDNCGNVATKYPETPIPAGRLQGGTTIVKNDGNSINLPIVYTPISGSLPIKVDVGGVPIKFDFDGAEIGDDTTAEALDELLTRLNDLDEALDRLEEKELLRSEKEKNAAIRNQDLLEELEDADSDKEGIDRLAYVEVRLATIPKSAKIQYGLGGTPDVIYAGWFEFKKGDYCFPREPIHFQTSCFQAPLGADGFAYTVHNGFIARNKVFKFKPSEEV